MGKKSEWTKVKEKGNPVYKTKGIEPIDLFKEGGILWDFAIGSIIKYAYRSRGQVVDTPGPTNLEMGIIMERNLNKIIHYAEMLKVVIDETKTKK
jgi:hypothetical protein